MQRRPSVELLDSDSGTPAEIAASLRDLRWFNQWFGGIATTRSLVETVARRCGRSQLSLLEVAAGDGYVPHTVAARLKESGIRLDLTLLDRAPSHLPKNGLVAKVSADAVNLPFADASFDIVSSSLFVHHLPPPQAVQFAREALRVSSCAVIVNDLIRHSVHLAIAYAGLPLYRSRLTRNDAPASVRQAYTVAEMRGLFQDAGATEIQVERHYLFRMGLIAWKDAPRK